MILCLRRILYPKEGKDSITITLTLCRSLIGTSFFYLYSFSDRVFISDRKTRQLVTQYATKGLYQDDVLQLRELACEHVACLVKLFDFLVECSPQDHAVIQCPQPWRKMIQGLASSSPVCALLPPDDTCIGLVKQMKEGDITKDPNVSVSACVC